MAKEASKPRPNKPKLSLMPPQLERVIRSATKSDSKYNVSTTYEPHTDLFFLSHKGRQGKNNGANAAATGAANCAGQQDASSKEKRHHKGRQGGNAQAQNAGKAKQNQQSQQNSGKAKQNAAAGAAKTNCANQKRHHKGKSGNAKAAAADNNC